MRLAAKIAFSIVTLTALGFCVAFVLEEIWLRAGYAGKGGVLVEQREVLAPVAAVVESVSDERWRLELARVARDEVAFADRVLREGELAGGLMVSLALSDLSSEQLEQHFAELMARDWDDYRAVEYAGRVLQAIAEREPEVAVALLQAMSPAEKEKLVPSVASGWTLRDPRAAFAWIGSAWVEADGEFIDRNLQNGLYMSAMDSLVVGLRDYELATEVLAGLADPDLKAALTDLVAHRIVRDGPETALDRLANVSSAVFDSSVMDAVAEQWAARDGAGAAAWVLENEEEMSSRGVRSIAKQLSLGAAAEALVGFHAGLVAVEKRDSVAAEVARLKARREPVASAGWVWAIEGPVARERAVFDALYEIGYESFGRSVNYIDYVYPLEDARRAPVVYATLRNWLEVDLDAVAGYLGSGRANLSADLSEELLALLASQPSG